ncbi:hypothetical protein EMCRGX_G000684 [Ephydatia muelleri]
MEGSSDVESDLVGEVFEYLLSGKYCDGASKERKRTIRKKALKFSVSSRGELFYRQKRKGKASTFCSGLSRKAIKQKRNACLLGEVLLRYIQSSKEQQKIALSSHIDPTSGHMGKSRTLFRIKERFMWHGMVKDVNNLISKCDVCQRMNRKLTTGVPQLHPISVKAPWYMIGIDFIGPVSPEAEDGSKYILTIFMRMGLPRVVVSDNGREFDNKLNDEICKTLGIKRRLITPYHPQPNLPIDIEMQSESVEELVKHYDEIVEPDHGEKFKEHISTLQEVAKNIKVAQIKYKKQYDKKHAKPSEFYIGQLVLKKDFTRKKTKGGKLSCRYVGPFTITRVKSRGVFELCSDDGKVTSATGGHLKVYRKPLGSDADHSSNPTHTSEDDGSLSNDGSISEDYRSTADDHFPLNGGLGLQLQMGDDVADKADNSADEMGDDAAQTPCSVADKADNSADGSIIEISNHTVDTVLYLPVCRDWQNNMCSVLGLQFVKGNRDHNEKPLDIALDQAPSIRGRIKGDGNCFFRAVAQEITGRQEDHAELRVLVTSYMAHNPAELSCYLTSSETMGQYLRTTKMDQQKVWATEIEIYGTANLLGTTIFVYCPSGTSNKWLRFAPKECHDDNSHARECLYLCNLSQHFETVKRMQHIDHSD